MRETNMLKEWRAVEIVKIFLLRLNQDLIIENSPTDHFDFIISFKVQPNIRFAIEVKSKQRFTSRVNKQIERLKKYRDQRLITIPVLIIKVDDIKEEAEFDFLVFPSFQQNKLLIRYTFKFSVLNKESFINKLKTIKQWYAKREETTPEKDSEIERRSIADNNLIEMANADLENAFLGKAVVGYIQIPGIQNSISRDLDQNQNGNLHVLLKIRKYVDYCVNSVQTVHMSDYSKNILIEEIEYPRVISYSDYFIFILPIDETSNQRKLASVFSVISITLELMNVALDNGFVIKGAIDFDNVYYNHNNLTLLGNALQNSEKLAQAQTNRFRVIVSNNIKNLIRDNLNNVNVSIIHYFRRFIFKDEDGWLTINPALILANTSQKAKSSLIKLKKLMSKEIGNIDEYKFKVLSHKIEEEDLEMKDISIFE